MATPRNKAAGDPEVVVFDGKTLPAGANEDWWGPPANMGSPEDGLRILQVPSFRPDNPGPATVSSARPGDRITRFPGRSEEYDRWEVDKGSTLPPDDQALTGPDMQMEYLRDAHERAHSLQPDETAANRAVNAPPRNLAGTAQPAGGQPPSPETPAQRRKREELEKEAEEETAAERRKREREEAKNS